MSLNSGSNNPSNGMPGLGKPPLGLIGTPRTPTGGPDVIFAGSGDDVVAGGGGNDLAFLGAGHDRFIWNHGDGSDLVDGQSGTDTLDFNGAGGAERISISAGLFGLAHMKRDVANVNMTMRNMERIELDALGGADTIDIGNLAGTGIQEIVIDLAGAAGGATGDGAIDKISLEGTKQADAIEIVGSGGTLAVVGASTFVAVRNADANDQFTVKAGAGDDTLNAATVTATAMQLTLDGGAGDDTILGGAGNETLIGGDGADSIDGNRGADVAFLGAGDDEFIWDPGEGSDTVHGEAGTDTLVFNGSNGDESFATLGFEGNGRLTRDVGNIVMDTFDVERFEITALGGTDIVYLQDMSGSAVREIFVDLRAAEGGSDGVFDNVVVDAATNGGLVTLTAEGDEILVSGVLAEVRVRGADATLDRIDVRGGDADDVIDASLMPSTTVAMDIVGGGGNDTLLAGAGDIWMSGSHGDDVLVGGEGDDLLSGGDGNDVLIARLGSDTLDGGEGDDLYVAGPGEGFDFTAIDFWAGEGTEDRVDLRAFGDFTFEQILAMSYEIDGNTVIDLGSGQMTLLAVNLSSLHQDDFLI